MIIIDFEQTQVHVMHNRGLPLKVQYVCDSTKA